MNPLQRDLERRKQAALASSRGEDPSVARARALMAAKTSEAVSNPPSPPLVQEPSPVEVSEEAGSTSWILQQLAKDSSCHYCNAPLLVATAVLLAGSLACQTCERKHPASTHAELCERPKCGRREAPAPAPPERPTPKPVTLAHYRLATSGDFGYILSSWPASFARTPLAMKMGDKLSQGFDWRARLLLAKWGARVACDPEDHDAIWGWACVAKKHGHLARVLFVYVREQLRGNGFARGLLGDLIASGEEVIVGAQSYGRLRNGRSADTRSCPACGEHPSSVEAWPLPKGWRFGWVAGTEWALAEGT